jgi:predicted nucleic acid-binding protein
LPNRQRRTSPAAIGVAPVFVDSGAWIALRSRRDQHHEEADWLFREAMNRRITLLTTNLVFAEVHRLTLFRAGVEPARRALDRIDASPRVTVKFPNAASHAAARRWLERLAPHPISYADAISFAVMEEAGCADVLGLDSDFVVAGFTLWRPRRNP